MAQVVGVAATFAEVWERVSSVIAELDVLCGFADLAASAPAPYARPTMLPPDGAAACLGEGWGSCGSPGLPGGVALCRSHRCC